MKLLHLNRMTLIWLGLIVAICVSWELFQGVNGLDAPSGTLLFADCWWIGVGLVVFGLSNRI